jgi:fructose/tagatose bisphosphate aldolase
MQSVFPEDMLRQAAKMAVCKINIDSDLRLAFTAGVREYLYSNPSHSSIPDSTLLLQEITLRLLLSIRSLMYLAVKALH